MPIKKDHKITKHARIRMLERTTLNHKERRDFYRKALRYGKNPQDIKNPKLRNYLHSKKRWNSYVKLYGGYVFLYSKNNKRLYTMYPLPEKFDIIE